MKSILVICSLLFALPGFGQKGFYYNKQNAEVIQKKLLTNKTFNQRTKSGNSIQKAQLAMFFGMANSTSQEEATNLATILLKALVANGTMTKAEMKNTTSMLKSLAMGKSIKEDIKATLKDNPNGLLGAIASASSSPNYTAQGGHQGFRRFVNKILGAWVGNNVGGAWGYLTDGYGGMIKGGIEGAKQGAAMGDALSDTLDGLENGGGTGFMPGPNGEDCTRPAGWPVH